MYSHYLDDLSAVLGTDLLLDVVELHLHGLRSLPQLFGYLVERPPFKIQFGDILFCRGESDHTLRLADHVLVRAELSPERAAYLLEVEDVDLLVLNDLQLSLILQGVEGCISEECYHRNEELRTDDIHLLILV